MIVGRIPKIFRQNETNETDNSVVYGMDWKDNIAILSGCLFFCVIGVLLTRNEIFLDTFYMEASADGFFGKDNRFLYTLCTNVLIETLIYVLSLTGLRLFWIKLIMIALDFVSTVVVCKYICEVISGKFYKLIACVAFHMSIIPLVYFDIEFTVTSVFAMGAGCVYMYSCIEQNKKWYHYFSAVLLMLMGVSFRPDGIAYPVVFMGVVCLEKIYVYYKENNNTYVVAKKYLMPFIIALLLLYGMIFIQNCIGETLMPGYKDWNTVRAYVDDYEIPPYEEFEEEYKKLGMSQNDYAILRAHNNMDENFFDADMYVAIKKIKDTCYQTSIQLDLKTVIKGIISLTSTYYFVIFLIGLIAVFLFSGMEVKVTYLIIGGVSGALAVFFLVLGRWIWRTEYPLLISALLAVICLIRFDKSRIQERSKDFKILFLGVSIFLVCFLTPVELNFSKWSLVSGKSLFQIYISQLEEDTLLSKYIIQKFKNESYTASETISRDFTSFCAEHKELFYYHLFTHSWIQPNPVPAKDVLRMEGINDGENYGLLGAYMPALPPLRKNESNYGITNRYADMINNNVRVTCTFNEASDRIRELKVYLNEHYYDVVTTSVDAVIDGNIIARFIGEVDYSGKYCPITKAKIKFERESEFKGFSYIELTDLEQSMEKERYDEYFIELVDPENGEYYTFATIGECKGSPIAYIDSIDLMENRNYHVYIIKVSNGKTVIKKLEDPLRINNK